MGVSERSALIKLLELQSDWGADEALLNAAQDRRGRMSVVERTEPIMAPPRAAVAATAGSVDLSHVHDLDGLRAALAAFEGCALKRTATQLVFADGAAAPLVLLIGEAPGAEEDRIGRPFVGPAGQLLDRMLGSISLDRGNVRIINTVPWRPPGNRTPSEAEVNQCLPFLWRHIALVRPRAVLLLGAVAVRAVLGQPVSITKIRGQWQEIIVPDGNNALPMLPTFHPAYLLRKPEAKREAWADLLALQRRIDP
jgi:uracil-DNA glycosylase family 4